MEFGIGIDSGVASYEETANYKLNDKVVKVQDVDVEAFLKWVATMLQKDKNMEYIIKFLKDNNYNITEEVKQTVTNAISNGKNTQKTKKR